jgi:Lhr-like helicase
LEIDPAVLTPPRHLLPEQFLRWFEARGWEPREHQLALLEKARDNRSALLIAPTGAGKTLAGFLPTLVELSGQRDRAPRRTESTGSDVKRTGGLHTLYISPLKALAVDIARNLEPHHGDGPADQGRDPHRRHAASRVGSASGVIRRTSC